MYKDKIKMSVKESLGKALYPEENKNGRRKVLKNERRR